MLALGVFPDVSLKRAREKRDAARQLLADGIDPSAQRKAEEHAERIAQLQTFEAVAREWLKRQSSGDSHGAGNTRRLEQHVFPRIDAAPIADLKRADMREVPRRIGCFGRSAIRESRAPHRAQPLDTRAALDPLNAAG